MSEFKCMHCMAKVDYVDVWGQQGDDWIEGDCPLTEEQCKNNWCDWHGCAAEFIQEDTNLAVQTLPMAVKTLLLQS